MRMKRLFSVLALLMMAVCFAFPAGAAGVLGPEDLIDTLYSSDAERYMKSHYIAADTMYTLTDVQIASILYEAIEGHREAAAKIWNFINVDVNDYMQRTVVELFLGEFVNSNSITKLSEFEAMGLLNFLDALDSAVTFFMPEVEQTSLRETISDIVKLVNQGKDVKSNLASLFRSIQNIDSNFFSRAKGLFDASDKISTVFTGLGIAAVNLVEMQNLYVAASTFSGLNAEFQIIFSQLKTNALSAGRHDLADAIDTVMDMSMPEGKVNATEFMLLYGGKTVTGALEFFLKTMLTKIGVKYALKQTVDATVSACITGPIFAYKAGTFVLNTAFNTDNIAQIYVRMEALADLEKTGNQTLKAYKEKLLNDPTYANARLFHTAMRIQQQIEVDACELFIELCKIFDANGFRNLFGSVDYGEFIKEYEDMRDSIAAKTCCGILEERAENKCREYLTYSIANDEVTITGYKYSDFAAIRIPDMIDGYPVTKIGTQAFYNHKKLAAIELPDITAIEAEAFKDCISLEQIPLPDTLETIGKGAFQNSAITTLELPDTVTVIPAYMVSGCYNLSSFSYYEGVTSIGEYAFSSTRITSFVIGEKTKTISKGTFENCTFLQTIFIHSDLTTIGPSAFKFCDSLWIIDIPDTVKTISDQAFYGCSALRIFSLPSGLTSLGNEAFMNSGALSITIPNGVTSIGSRTFASCNYLRNITLPPYLSFIGQGAFSDTAITEIDIPGSVMMINAEAFMNCEKLMRVQLPSSLMMLSHSVFYGCSSLQSVNLPNSLSTIGEYAFYGCGMKELDLPDRLISIGKYAFSECNQLQSLSFPPGGYSIGEGAFSNCRSLRALDLSRVMSLSATHIFAGCSSLMRVKFPIDLSRIPASTFQDCSNLKLLIFEGDMYTFGADAFRCGNSGETGVEYLYMLQPSESISQYFEANYPSVRLLTKEKSAFPFFAPLATIEEEAFAGSSLTTVSLPDTLTSIGPRAFADCAQLTQIAIPASVTDIAPTAFDGCTDQLIFFAPEGSAAEGFALEHDILCIPHYIQ